QRTSAAAIRVPITRLRIVAVAKDPTPIDSAWVAPNPPASIGTPTARAMPPTASAATAPSTAAVAPAFQIAPRRAVAPCVADGGRVLRVVVMATPRCAG